MVNRPKIAIISDSDYFVETAGALTSCGCQVLLYFSQSHDNYINERVLQFCNASKIQIFIESSSSDLYTWIIKNNPDITFIFGYSKLINIDRLTNKQIFNIHYGSLPEYKGPSPVFWQLKNGENELCVTIHKLNNKFDEGAVVWFKKTKNTDYMNFKIANLILSKIVVEGVMYLINFLVINKLQNIIEFTKEANAISKYYKRPQLNDVLIKWDAMSSKEIINLVKACNPWNKGAITYCNGNECKLLDATIVQWDSQSDEFFKTHSKIGGTIISTDDKLLLYTIDNMILKVDTLFYLEAFINSRHLKHYNIKAGDKLH